MLNIKCVFWFSLLFLSDENPSSVSRVFRADGRTDRHVEANSRFSQFFNVPYKMIIKKHGGMHLSEVLVISAAL